MCCARQLTLLLLVCCCCCTGCSTVPDSAICITNDDPSRIRAVGSRRTHWPRDVGALLSLVERRTSSRPKALIEGYVATLPGLHSRCGVMSGRRWHLAGMYVKSDAGKNRGRRRSWLLDYRGWILSEAEYERFGYSVHMAVHQPLPATRRSDGIRSADELHHRHDEEDRYKARSRFEGGEGGDGGGVSTSIVTVHVASARRFGSTMASSCRRQISRTARTASSTTPANTTRCCCAMLLAASVRGISCACSVPDRSARRPVLLVHIQQSYFILKKLHLLPLHGERSRQSCV